MESFQKKANSKQETQQEKRARMMEEARQRVEQERNDRLREEYTLLGDASKEELDGVSGSGSFSELEHYSYFDGDQMIRSLNLPADSRRMGEKLYRQGLVENMEVTTGYERYGEAGEMVGQAVWDAQIGRNQFQTTVTFTRASVSKAQCSCPKCRKKYGGYGWYYGENANCEYVAAVLFGLRDYLKTHNVGDATDRDACVLMNAYRQKRANLLVADKTAKEQSLTLKPRLVKKNSQLTVSFKIGAGKLFVIKQLDEFCMHVRNAATATYGSSTEINHRRSNFTGESLKWLRFIERIVQEEEEFGQRLEHATRNRYYYHITASVGGSLNLFGWRLDELYNELGDGTVEYEDRDAERTKKQILHRGEGNPHVTMEIAEAVLPVKKERKGWIDQIFSPESVQEEFHGIQVNGNLPELFFGMNCAYYVDGDTFRRSEPEFQEKIEDLIRLAGGNESFSFRIGRNSMSEFYYQVLPTLRDVAEIVEKDPERIHSFLPPQVNFVFYLDAREGDVTCAPFARYEGKELSLLDFIQEEQADDETIYRDSIAEQETLYKVMTWLPQIDMTRKELNCGGDEDQIYRVMSEGIDELITLGEVQCTNRFRARRTIRQVKVSVGVSVSSGLLDLDITTEDVPQDELLDILNSYREKKNYYRLRDGSYVNLDDQSLEMLAEMMDSMHLKPKEFVQGKMHLPLYRTLYLNKMLEENDSVYSERDSRFREMVKEFKTVNDADFDVPKSLSKIMRQYQKDGYKWLRTLETWQFGGILADDMGLGKTLQAIALLLSAKERYEKAAEMAQAPLSLIVAPASLVFNWGEEFARFAPALRVELVTGTQEERQGKIAAYRNFDVLVTSYDLLKRDIPHYEGIAFTYEIIDEAQYIKNHTTAAAKAVKVINSRYRYALTGTPIENRLSELWSIFDYLMPGFLYTYDVFKREIETPAVKYQDEQAMKRLQKMTGPFILRRLKEEVLKDLPDKLEEVRYVRLAAEQQQLYDGQVIHMRETIAGQDVDAFNKNKLVILTELMRLRQICCDPSLCLEGYRGESSKADACMELIHSAIDGGHRMLLFSQFTSMLEILQGRLDADQVPYYTITGSTSKQKRLELVKQFNAGNTPVFLISLKAGGVGLNLTGADVVIHYDPWWNVAAQNQATDRAHRIGQTKKVTVYKLIAKNSIEEKILKLQEDKRELADQVISGETGQLSGMTREDLLELLDGK
ncbi:MAG: SNF2 family helicase [Lachnospiraceae bacterium]|nr:SNF2 family helicase [Lachnospiraceae bacterium]